MSSQDWERFGEEIRRTVQDAVESQDYAKLNQTIVNTLNDAVSGAANSIKNWGAGMGRPAGGGPFRQPPPRWQQQKEQRQVSMPPANTLFLTGGSTKAGGVVLAALGYTFGGMLLLAFLIVLSVGVAADMPLGIQIALLTLGILTAGCGAAAGVGTKILKRLGRFRAYVRALSGREYCNIQELSGVVRKPFNFTVKDLEKMIRSGWFRQGHLDQRKSCLIVTDQMYNQYLRLEEQRRQQEIQRMEEGRHLEEERRLNMQKASKNAEQMKTPASAKAQLPPEVQKIIEQGDAYIRKIRECNDAIPGEEISVKISRMEMLVERIFDRVEQNPETVSDIRKLMEYYLPTTVKLLEAYAELDGQPIDGENIQTARREIEKTLDTLNMAFEKLLDSLFQDTAWDVSSDISVLHAMLAQEGLTEDGIPR
ncbi:MAG: hypothetical protein HFG41_06040 [Coprococcus sp.]|nr:hypothetical protein [Coprococcus sp.]